MKKVTFLWLLAGLPLTSCSGLGGAHSDANSDGVIPICAFPSIATSNVGARVRVRGKMTLHAHGILLSDEECPNVRVHLKQAPGGPDISLCGSPELIEQFGCPAGGDAGPIVTVVGELSGITEADNAFLLVEQLVEFERNADAERN